VIRAGVYVFALFAGTFLLLFFAADASWHMPLQPAHRITLHGADFSVISGAGAQDEDALNIGSVGDDDNAVQTIALDHVGADDYPVLRYGFENFPRTLELSLIFRRADTPGDVHAIALPRPENGTKSYDLRTIPAWRGDILEVGFAEFPTAQLVAKGHGFHPFNLMQAELWSPSASGVVSALLTDWFTHWSWSMRSVSALGRDIDTPRKFSLVLALAVWSVIAFLLGMLILHWRGRHIGVGAFVCIAAAWLLLDMNWQSGLFWKNGLTRDMYAGKSWDERSRMIADAPLLDVAVHVRESMHAQPANTHVLLADDSPYELLRLVYHLLPANVAPLGWVAGLLGHTPVGGGPIAYLAAGSVVVYYHVRESAFDESHARLHIGEVSYPATPLLETRSLSVYRISGTP
jgi:hypothetical protein